MNGWGSTIEKSKPRLTAAVDYIFSRLVALHGERYVGEKLGVFADDEKTLAVKAQWANELIHLPRELVKNRLEKAVKGTFCPTLAQFVNAILPTAEEAFNEAQSGFLERDHGREFAFSCPAVYWAWVRVEGVRHSEWLKAKAKWSSVWDSALEEQSRGVLAGIPPVVARIERKEPVAVAPSAAVVAKIKSLGGLHSNVGDTRWAFNLPTLSTARCLVSTYSRGVNRDILHPAVEHHLNNTRKLVMRDGVLMVGERSLFAR